MGIPYSREINAAFEQVTPLVAAGFKVLKTTRNISILLAAIQVLTVILLFAILVVLVMLCYCVNPDLEHERRILITPLLRSLTRISPSAILKTLFIILAAFALAALLAWRLFLFRQWVEDVEYEANVDADKALEEIEHDESKDKKKKNNGGKKEKGKKKDKNGDEQAA